jgi:LDH2 family malate/lactate/ureidoglycolate dehydrogenase
MLVLQGAVDTAVETAQEFGVAIVGVHNLYSSSGALGYYAQRLGRAGMIGAIMTGTPSVVAPFGAKEGLFGTNPLAVAIPRAHGDPVVLDFATAEIALFEVIRRRNLGEELPVGAAKDRFGNPTTDPKAALEGSINCFGGAKGSGLSCILEILTSVFVGAAVADLAEPKRDFGALIICGRPNLFVSGAEYRSALDWFIQQFSLLTPVSDTSNVRLPGANPVNPNRVVVSLSIWAPILKLAGV